jgi:hypothetical protein
MKKFILSQPILANELIPYGIKNEFDLTNSKMKLLISDKNLEKYRCDLLEEDYSMVHSTRNHSKSSLKSDFPSKKQFKGV